jgi:hypothetical protein
MGVYHLISVAEDQLRTHGGDQASHERAVGLAVIEACLNADSRVSTAMGHADEVGQESSTQPVIVTYVDEQESDEFAMWVWSSGESVCIADLSDQDLDLIIKLAHAVKAKLVHDPDNSAPGT